MSAGTGGFPGLRALHWPHLLLLAAWPVWWWMTAGHCPPPVAVALWFALNLLVLVWAERVRPYRTDWRPSAAHLRRDGGVLAINALVDAVAGMLLSVAAMAAGADDSRWPLWLQIVVALWLTEFGSYWLHRLSHGEGWLWRAHLMHHRPDRMSASNAVMAHPFNALYDKCARMLPLALLGFDDAAVLAVALFGITQSLVTHANVAGTIGALDYIVGSAALHRLHHSTRAAEAGNFGTALPLWDQLFGTYRRGGAPFEVGVFDPGRYPGEFDVRALLMWPLRRLCRARGIACCAR